MSTGTSLIQKALRKIGAHSKIREASAESIGEGLDSLNSMLQLWLSRGIDLGIVPLDAPGDELGEPADTTQAITESLAIILAPDREGGKEVVSPTLRSNARDSFNMVKSLYQNHTIPTKVLSSTTPRGAGNTRGSGDRRIFFNSQAELEN